MRAREAALPRGRLDALRRRRFAVGLELLLADAEAKPLRLLHGGLGAHGVHEFRDPQNARAILVEHAEEGFSIHLGEVDVERTERCTELGDLELPGVVLVVVLEAPEKRAEVALLEEVAQCLKLCLRPALVSPAQFVVGSRRRRAPWLLHRHPEAARKATLAGRGLDPGKRRRLGVRRHVVVPDAEAQPARLLRRRLGLHRVHELAQLEHPGAVRVEVAEDVLRLALRHVDVQCPERSLELEHREAP